MKQAKLSVAISVATALAAASPGPVRAQTGGGYLLEEILVTAQKKEENLQEIPISIKAIISTTLSTINAESLEDITRLVPSLSMTDIQRGGNNVQIRGLGSNVGSVGTIALYNDGIISFGRIQSSGTFSEQDSSLYDVERIEVLRGPQGTLYGEGSFGGVINIISKRANPEKFEASFSGSVFDVDEGSSDNTDLAAMVNIPLIEDKLAARVVGFRNDHDGYIDGYNVLDTYIAGLYQSIGQTYEALFPGFCSNPLSPYASTFICTADPEDTPPELLGRDLNTEKVTGGRIMLDYVGDGFDAGLIYKTQKSEFGISSTTSSRTIAAIDAISGGTIGNPEFTQALFESVFGSENTTDEVILNVNVELPVGTLTSITGYGDIEEENTAAVFDTGGYSQELRLASNNSGPVSWIAGAFYRTVERKIDLITGEDFLTNEVDQWSVFGQVYWDINETLTATFGLRYSEEDSFFMDEINAAVLGSLSRVDATFTDVSPKVALDWKMDEDTLLYASIAKGFRGGGASADVSLGTDNNFRQSFDPDEIWNYEIGLKKSLWERKVTVNAALFHIDWSDIQIDRPIADLVTGSGPESREFIVTNGEDAHSTGIEADIYITPARGWAITVGGSYVEAEFDSGSITSAFVDAAHPDGVFELDGLRLPSSPKYLFNASVEKNFAVIEDIEGYVRLDYSIRDSSFGDVPNEPEGADLKSGRFDLTNLRAGLRGDVWEVQIFVVNLTNENASSFNFDDGSTFALGGFRARLTPRTVGVNLKLGFN